MFLSIITINRNNAEGLKKTLESVASQTCRDFEHIIIDGASTDGSVDVIKEYVASPAGKNVSYWVSEPDSGVYNAMNKGIKKAIGDYCLFLNSGDWLFNSDTIKNESNQNHTADIIIFNPMMIKSDLIKSKELPDYYPCHFFLEGNAINHQNELIKTKLLKKEPYNENLKIFSDSEFNIKSIIHNKASYIHYPYSISYYEATTGLSTLQRDLLEKEKKQVLTECFGCYEQFLLLQDYETGYGGILKKIRLLLNFIASKTTRKQRPNSI